MNVIYLGDGSYGVEAAAETYFGEPVAKLTVAQDAVIAAIIQQPSTYYLPQYRTNLTNRWQYVLSGMVKIGDLSQAQADSMKFPKLLTDSPSYSPPGLSSGCSTTSTQPWAAYLMTQACDELEAPATDGGYHLNPTEVDNGGMKVVTTVSLPMEEEIYKAVNENTAQMSQVEGEYGKTDIGLPSWAADWRRSAEPEQRRDPGRIPRPWGKWPACARTMSTAKTTPCPTTESRSGHRSSRTTSRRRSSRA